MGIKNPSSRRHPSSKPPARGGFAGPSASGAPAPSPAPAELQLLASYQARIEALEANLRGARDYSAVLGERMDKMRRAEAWESELFELTPAAYVVHDATGFILAMNPAAKAILDWRPTRSSKPSMVQFLSPHSVVRWLDHLRACFKTRRSGAAELILRSPNAPQRVRVLTSPSSQRATGGCQVFYSLIVDNSGADSGHVALMEKERRLCQLIDLVEGIVWEADPEDLSVTFVSSYAERLLGFPLSDWSLPDFWRNRIFVEDRDRVLDALNRAVAGHQELRIEYRMMTTEREIVWLHDCIRLFEQEGRRRLLGVAIDITERRAAEEQLQNAHAHLEQRVAERTTELRQTVADLEGFSYSLSHDMRAPIRAMQGYASLVKEMTGDELGPQPRLFLQRIMESAERLDLLVQDVLKYSRTARAPLELKPVPLQPLVESILHDFPALEVKRSSIQIEEPLPCVLAHEAFIGQALSNLLTNAIKFVPKGRDPWVRVRAESVRGGASGRVEPWVRIWVEDNGLGIAPEDQGRIFRFFERVYPEGQYEGTGMGLAIVQKAVERLGGRVGVESKPAEGSRFWIELPQA